MQTQKNESLVRYSFGVQINHYPVKRKEEKTKDDKKCQEKKENLMQNS